MASEFYSQRDNEGAFGKLRPPMFMPRWASRFYLIVTDVRVQRLQEISEADAMAEGIVGDNVIMRVHGSTGVHVEETEHRYFNGTEEDESLGVDEAVECYANLWEHINGEGSWALNPWVQAISYRLVRGNIDEKGGEA